MPTIGDISDSESMAFCLPKPGFDVIDITLTCWEWKLVEGYINRHCDEGFLFEFPMTFLASVEIFANSICAGIPPADLLGTIVADRVVREREGEFGCHEVSQMHKTMHLIIDSIENRDFKMVSSVYLRNWKHAHVSDFWAFFQLQLNLLEILNRGPRIRVYYRQYYWV